MKLIFPAGFAWGTAISGFQTEMGSGPASIYTKSDWYEWANNEQMKKEGLISGDKPQDGDGFWDLYKEDMMLARSLGNNAFRMSIEWPRIFPESTEQVDVDFGRNEKGEPLKFSESGQSLKRLKELSNPGAVERYSEMIDFAHSLGLKVFMTLYHWPLPIWLHDPVKCHNDPENTSLRGWLDVRTVEEFAKYAYFISQNLGPKVDVWETINEPETVAISGYILGKSTGFPPALENIPMGFLAERNMAFAHNLAYHILKKHTGREVGIGTAPPYFVPTTQSDRDKEMADTARYLYNEWIMNAAVKGEFDNSLDGTPDERIDDFGGSDYVGINYYTRMRVSYSEEDMFAGSLPLKIEPCENCTEIGMDTYPEGFRSVLKWAHKNYNRPMYILENGIADATDQKRGDYIISHLRELSKAIAEDQMPVKGYFHWSLIDNFEWERGYSMRLGLYEVDYRTKDRRRRPSAEIYEKICKGEDI